MANIHENEQLINIYNAQIFKAIKVYFSKGFDYSLDDAIAEYPKYFSTDLAIISEINIIDKIREIQNFSLSIELEEIHQTNETEDLVAGALYENIITFLGNEPQLEIIEKPEWLEVQLLEDNKILLTGTPSGPPIDGGKYPLIFQLSNYHTTILIWEFFYNVH